MTPVTRSRAGAPLLAARDLSVRTRSGATIVRGLDLEVGPGEAIGIVGESGSGKSMTAKALIGLLPPGVVAAGEVEQGGENLLELSERALRRVRGRRVGLIMQDPFTMLSPLLRCGVQITDGLTRNGRKLRGATRTAEAVRRLAEVGIRDAEVAERFPFELSGGMRQRVGIAAALARDPELLIADEPSTALDVTTQKEILQLLRSLQRSRQMGLILITHDLRVASENCNRIYVMYAGNILEVAAAGELDAEPRHPYTLGLLNSEPPLEQRLAELPVIEGTVPRPDAVAGECAFAARCRWARPQCCDQQPALAPVAGDGRLTACVRSDELAEEMVGTRRLDVASAAREERSEVRALVRVKDLAKTFAGGSSAKQALAGVTLQIGFCESVGLVGESGSGKTTLGRCVMGLETPTAGTIEIDGIATHSFADLERSMRAQIRHKVQMIFQDPYSSLNPVRTIGSTLSEAIFARDPRARRADEEVASLLHRVGLPAAYATRKPSALSGGERQRVAIARALAMRPQLIVCDEPVSALDVSVQAQVLNLLTDLRDEYEVSYLFITHDLAVVRQIAERIYVLHDGLVVESGNCDAVLDEPRDAYTKELVLSVPGARNHLQPEPGRAGQSASSAAEGK